MHKTSKKWNLTRALKKRLCDWLNFEDFDYLHLAAFKHKNLICSEAWCEGEGIAATNWKLNFFMNKIFCLFIKNLQQEGMESCRVENVWGKFSEEKLE